MDVKYSDDNIRTVASKHVYITLPNQESGFEGVIESEVKKVAAVAVSQISCSSPIFKVEIEYSSPDITTGVDSTTRINFLVDVTIWHSSPLDRCNNTSYTQIKKRD